MRQSLQVNRLTDRNGVQHAVVKISLELVSSVGVNPDQTTLAPTGQNAGLDEVSQHGL